MLLQLYRAINKRYVEEIEQSPIKSYIEKLYADEAPPGISYPIATFTDVSTGVEARTICKGVNSFTMEFRVYSVNADRADYLGRLLHQIYNNYNLPLEDGLKTISCKLDSRRVTYDRTDNIYVYIGRYTYNICESIA